MSGACLIIIVVVLEGRAQADVACDYGVSRGWVFKRVACYRAGGEAVFGSRSGRPLRSPNVTLSEVVELVIRLRHELVGAGQDAGSDMIVWYLYQHYHVSTSARQRSAAIWLE